MNEDDHAIQIVIHRLCIFYSYGRVSYIHSNRHALVCIIDRESGGRLIVLDKD